MDMQTEAGAPVCIPKWIHTSRKKNELRNVERKQGNQWKPVLYIMEWGEPIQHLHCNVGKNAARGKCIVALFFNHPTLTSHSFFLFSFLSRSLAFNVCHSLEISKCNFAKILIELVNVCAIQFVSVYLFIVQRQFSDHKNFCVSHDISLNLHEIRYEAKTNEFLDVKKRNRPKKKQKHREMHIRCSLYKTVAKNRRNFFV